MKTSELTGAALDWAVAKCEGTLGVRPSTCRNCQHHEERAITDSSEHICHLSFMSWTGGGYVDDTPFGDGISVEYGVHQNCPIDTNTASPYSTDWSQGGPIIEEERIFLKPSKLSPTTSKRISWGAHGFYGNTGQKVHRHGPTPLIAAMRCYVASKLGDDVDVPEELQ